MLLQDTERRLALFQFRRQRIQAGLALVVLAAKRIELPGNGARVQAATLGGQGLTATRGIGRLLLQVFDLGPLHFRPAGRFGLRFCVRIPSLLPVVERGLGNAQLFLALAVAGAKFRQLRFGRGDGVVQVAKLALVAGDVLADLGEFRICLRPRRLQPLPQLTLVGDLLLDARQLAADPITFGLHPTQLLAGLALLHPAGLDLRFGRALFGQELLQLCFVLGQQFAQGNEFGVELAVFQRLELGIPDQAFRLQSLVLLRGTRLALEMVDLLVHFLAQVSQALEVFAGVADPCFGFLAPLLVFRDAGGLLEVDAKIFGPRLDDLRNHALLDDRVAARAQAGAQEQVGDVAATTARAIEVIVGLAVPADRALDGNFAIAGVFPADRPFRIVEHQLHGSLADRLARGRTGKDHIGQAVAAQAAGRAFAHHPAHRVDDVRFPAAIRPDHAGHVGRQVEHGGIDEGFETGELYR